MRYKSLFKNLKIYGNSTPDLNLKQYREILGIFWKNMAPSEKYLFVEVYREAIDQITVQTSLHQILETIEKKE
ncbi:unnamed protein product [marine sediment metagenome]|uniref:Uncharacterized protein n=1 Tax=marine sediment metagenome TaxID=412755 RepID=X1DC81_9ZZZZ